MLILLREKVRNRNLGDCDYSPVRDQVVGRGYLPDYSGGLVSFNPAGTNDWVRFQVETRNQEGFLNPVFLPDGSTVAFGGRNRRKGTTYYAVLKCSASVVGGPIATVTESPLDVRSNRYPVGWHW